MKLLILWLNRAAAGIAYIQALQTAKQILQTICVLTAFLKECTENTKNK